MAGAPVQWTRHGDSDGKSRLLAAIVNAGSRGRYLSRSQMAG
jgi:hypothetical protein